MIFGFLNLPNKNFQNTRTTFLDFLHKLWKKGIDIMRRVIYNRGNLRRLNCEATQVICMTWKTAPLSNKKAVFSLSIFIKIRHLGGFSASLGRVPKGVRLDIALRQKKPPIWQILSTNSLFLLRLPIWAILAKNKTI